MSGGGGSRGTLMVYTHKPCSLRERERETETERERETETQEEE